MPSQQAKVARVLHGTPSSKLVSSKLAASRKAWVNRFGIERAQSVLGGRGGLPTTPELARGWGRSRIDYAVKSGWFADCGRRSA